MKWIAGCLGLVAIIGASTLLYRGLSSRYKPESNLIPAAPSSSANAPSSSALPDENKTQQPSESAAPEKLKPDFTMEDAQGNAVKLSDFEGKPVVLNFWATWCGYCAMEMPEFDEVYQEMGEEVQFIMLDVVDGARETKEKGMAFIQEKGFTFPVFFDTEMQGGNVFGVSSLPTTYFIDQDGYLVTYAQGMIDKETLQKGIEMAKAGG